MGVTSVRSEEPSPPSPPAGTAMALGAEATIAKQHAWSLSCSRQEREFRAPLMLSLIKSCHDECFIISFALLMLKEQECSFNVRRAKLIACSHCHFLRSITCSLLMRGTRCKSLHPPVLKSDVLIFCSLPSSLSSF